jgi:Neuraminidase (sialidase)
MNNTVDIDTLYFPQFIAPYIGISKERIGFLKRKGCPFFGRKTTIRWVRAFIEENSIS